MYRKLSICFYTALFFLYTNVESNGQNTPDNQPDKYERTSISFCFLNVPQDKYASNIEEVFTKLKVNDKYNNHSIPEKMVFPSPYDRYYIGNNRSDLVRRKLEEIKISNKIISKWFSQKQDGSFSMDLISQRGVYNATDQQVLEAKAAKRGNNILKDAGESLLRKSYIAVFDFMDVESYNDYYNKQDERLLSLAKASGTQPKRVSRVRYGYRGALWVYVYKVDWNDSLSGTFYNQVWSNPSLLEKMKIPIKYTGQVYVTKVEGSQLQIERNLSDKDLLLNMVQNGIESALVQISVANPEFRVKTPVFSVRPIRAKIGLKEDVKIDQRFFIYEVEQDEKGNLSQRKRGVVRATKYITDNRTEATGETKPTTFYQESGKRIYPGMFMEQRYDNGLSISLGWGQRSLQGPIFRLDYNLSWIFDISLFRLYVEGQIGGNNVTYGNGKTTYGVSSYSLAAGLSKEYCLLRNIHLEPHIGILYDTTWASLNKTEENALKSQNFKLGFGHWGVMAGLRMPINILHNLQLVPSVTFSTINYSAKSSLFGSTISDKMPQEFIDAAKIDKNDANWQQNKNANLNNNPFKWEVTLRLKF